MTKIGVKSVKIQDLREGGISPRIVFVKFKPNYMTKLLTFLTMPKHFKGTVLFPDNSRF